MKLYVDKDDILTRKADDSGRVSIGKNDYAGKVVEVAVLEVKEKQ